MQSLLSAMSILNASGHHMCLSTLYVNKGTHDRLQVNHPNTDTALRDLLGGESVICSRS